MRARRTHSEINVLDLFPFITHAFHRGMGASSSALGLAQDRPSSTMSSRKLQALDFIKCYFAQWGQSPTIGEIASTLGVSRQRAHDLVHQLSTDAMIEVVAGKPSGIRLLERGAELSEVDILLQLAAREWTIAHGDLVLHAPEEHGANRAGAAATVLGALTRTELSRLPVLDHDSSLEEPPHTSQAPLQRTRMGTGTNMWCKAMRATIAHETRLARAERVAPQQAHKEARQPPPSTANWSTKPERPRKPSKTEEARRAGRGQSPIPRRGGTPAPRPSSGNCARSRRRRSIAGSTRTRGHRTPREA